MNARLTHEELDAIDDVLSRAPGCPDLTCSVCQRIAGGRAAWAKARALLERVPADVAALAADAADYEQRWLAECRAHGEAKRALEALEQQIKTAVCPECIAHGCEHCRCEPGSAYLCSSCERKAEEQPHAF